MIGLLLACTMSTQPAIAAIKPGHVIWTFPDVGISPHEVKPPGATYVELMLPNDGARVVENGQRIVDGKPFGNATVVRVGEKSLTLRNKAGKTYELPLQDITHFKITKPEAKP